MNFFQCDKKTTKKNFVFREIKLLSGNEMDRCCAERIRNKPIPESGRKPAKRRLLVDVGEFPIIGTEIR